MHTVHQSFIRGDVHHVELCERDELGRQVGGFVVVDVPVSAALRAAIATDYAAAIGAQDATITEAKAEIAAGRKPKALVADLKPRPKAEKPEKAPKP